MNTKNRIMKGVKMCDQERSEMRILKFRLIKSILDLIACWVLLTALFFVCFAIIDAGGPRESTIKFGKEIKQIYREIQKD